MSKTHASKTHASKSELFMSIEPAGYSGSIVFDRPRTSYLFCTKQEHEDGTTENVIHTCEKLSDDNFEHDIHDPFPPRVEFLMDLARLLIFHRFEFGIVDFESCVDTSESTLFLILSKVNERVCEPPLSPEEVEGALRWAIYSIYDDFYLM